MQICPYSLATGNIYHVALLWLAFSPVLGQRKGSIRPLSGNPNHDGSTCTRTNELVLYQETSRKINSAIALAPIRPPVVNSPNILHRALQTKTYRTAKTHKFLKEDLMINLFCWEKSV